MSTRTSVAIEIGRASLCALRATYDRGTLRVEQVVDERLDAPADADAAALGEVVGGFVRSHGLAGERVTLVLAREHVGLKRVALPTIDVDELPDMARLVLQRELPFDADAAIIDYVPLADDGVRTTVLAVAAPAEVCEHAQAVARAAGLRVDCITLRVLGVAALVPDSLRALVIDVKDDGIEFCIVERGVIRFSRAASRLVDGGAPDTLTEWVLTEARRTWMSYRIVEGASDVDAVLVLGGPELAPAVPVLGEMLGARATRPEVHPWVEAPRGAVDRVWPLVGLFLAAGQGTALIDFMNPRRPGDHAATRRRRLLLGAGAVASFAMLLGALGYEQVGDLRREKASLETRYREDRAAHARYARDQYRLAHLNRWPIDVDWLAHAQHVGTLMPEPSELVLDSWVGGLDFGGVRFDRESGTWLAPWDATIVIDGEAIDRETADRFRATLVESKRYVATSSGADAAGGRRLPYGFTYRLGAGGAGAGADADTGEDTDADTDADTGEDTDADTDAGADTGAGADAEHGKP